MSIISHLYINWASKCAAMDVERLKSGSYKLNTCLFKLFITNHALAIVDVRLSKTCKALMTNLTMCSKNLQYYQNPSSQIVAITTCTRVWAWWPFCTLNNVFMYSFHLGSMNIISKASLASSMRAIMKKLHANLTSSGTFNDSLDE